MHNINNTGSIVRKRRLTFHTVIMGAVIAITTLFIFTRGANANTVTERYDVSTCSEFVSAIQIASEGDIIVVDGQVGSLPAYANGCLLGGSVNIASGVSIYISDGATLSILENTIYNSADFHNAGTFDCHGTFINYGSFTNYVGSTLAQSGFYACSSYFGPNDVTNNLGKINIPSKTAEPVSLTLGPTGNYDDIEHTDLQHIVITADKSTTCNVSNNITVTNTEDAANAGSVPILSSLAAGTNTVSFDSTGIQFRYGATYVITIPAGTCDGVDEETTASFTLTQTIPNIPDTGFIKSDADSHETGTVIILGTVLASVIASLICVTRYKTARA